MKHTNASTAETSPRTPWLARAPRRHSRGLGGASLSTALVALLMACRGAPEPVEASRGDEALASAEQSLLAECRSTADDCVDSALDLNDVSACGAVLAECVEDVSTDVRGAFPIARPLLSRLLVRSVRAVRGFGDVAEALPAIALSGVRTCRDEVVSCLDGAADLDVGVCADSLDACVGGVVDIIDPIVAPLPGPSGSGIVAATDACRSDARDCLAGALSVGDITSCKEMLGACADGVDAIVGETLEEVNEITDPLAVPNPGEVVDCTFDLAECLADFQNPFDCAEQARACALP